MSIGRIALLLFTGYVAGEVARTLDAILILAEASPLARKLAFIDVLALAWLFIETTRRGVEH